jgi:hypothetical protein
VPITGSLMDVPPFTAFTMFSRASAEHISFCPVLHGVSFYPKYNMKFCTAFAKYIRYEYLSVCISKLKEEWVSPEVHILEFEFLKRIKFGCLLTL